MNRPEPPTLACRDPKVLPSSVGPGLQGEWA